MPHIVNPYNLKAAKAQWSIVIKSKWFNDHPKNIQELFLRFPPYKFYTDKEGKTAHRVIGVLELKDGLWLESAFLTDTTLVTGECKPEDLKEVDFYEGEAYEKIITGAGNNEDFLLPSGFTAMISES